MNARVYQTREWKRVRQLVLERDDFECGECGSRSDLVVHHVDRNNTNHALENLETLCELCHVKEHHNARSSLDVLASAVFG
jgi:5-methylcytosine-specific restriction enzyme A